jgi:thiol-disulfide isomerase/thioredoxin
VRRILLLVALLASASSVVAASLRPFDAGSLERIKKAHAGKPFVLAFWSVTCEPCREEMPVWKAMRAKHPRIPIVLVAADSPTATREISRFLSKHDPGPVERWAFADDFAERVRHSVDPKWRGELPRTYFFDADHGARAHSGVISAPDADAWFAKQAARPTKEKP